MNLSQKTEKLKESCRIIHLLSGANVWIPFFLVIYTGHYVHRVSCGADSTDQSLPGHQGTPPTLPD